MAYYPPSPSSPRPPQGRPRSYTGFWAALTFTTLLLCSALVLLMLSTGGQLPQIGNGPSWTPPAPAAGNAPSSAGAGMERSPSRPFLPGDTVQNASGGRVNLRQSPGFQNKPAGDVILVVQPGDSGTVLEGPVQADGLNWWRIRFVGGEGWMAERSNSGKVLLSLAPR